MDNLKNLSGFSKLTLFQRLELLKELDVLSEQDIAFLLQGGVKDARLAEKFIENVIGWFQLPIGVATNFRIDQINRLIPMAVEETSIIAAASKTAKWVRDNGSITTEVVGSNIIGQIQLAKITDETRFNEKITQTKREWIDLVNKTVAMGLVSRGGGVRDLQVRYIDRGDGYKMAVIHVFMDPCDAMGANVINQVCEFLKEPIEKATQEKVTMCILSNLVDSKVTKAYVELSVEPELGEKIQEASLFAQLDPYRAATNNKGVLNGIDPILIATGNDWRAVEAGIHAFAVQNGQYRSITKWQYSNGILRGVFEAPLIVGTVGGVTALHPMARISMKILDITSSQELSRVAAAVGLVQNLGALRALTTVGIIEGHMKLHTKNLALGAGALENEIEFVVERLEDVLRRQKRISMSHAVKILEELRAQAH